MTERKFHINEEVLYGVIWIKITWFVNHFRDLCQFLQKATGIMVFNSLWVLPFTFPRKFILETLACVMESTDSERACTIAISMSHFLSTL